MPYDKNQCALTPPMGWNSWDCYGASVTEDALLENARAMRERLLPHGWRYAVCDIQWSEPNPNGTSYRPFAKLCMDEFGRLLPAPNRFPSGFAAIAAVVHDMGLKFGIHIMRGVPRQAVYADCPVAGTPYTARDIALPFRDCRWNSDMYAVNPRHPGAQAYYDSLFSMYAGWGVDYVKADDVCRTDYEPNDSYAARSDVEMIRRAIDRAGREMVLSLSPGPARVECAWHLSKHANLWRMTDDLWDEWPLVKAMFPRFEAWQAFARPGSWPDADMLPLGTLRMWRGGEPSMLSRDEQRLLMSMWCLFRSPLMMGGELTRMDDFTYSLLTCAPALALQQSPYAARQLSRDENEAVWAGKDADGANYIGLFNLSDEMRAVRADARELDAPAGAQASDVWTGEALCGENGAYSALLRPHACALARLAQA